MAPPRFGKVSSKASTNSGAQSQRDAAWERWKRLSRAVGQNLFASGLEDARNASKQARSLQEAAEALVRLERLRVQD